MERWVKALIFTGTMALFFVSFMFFDYISFLFLFIPFCCWDNYIRNDDNAQEQTQEINATQTSPGFEEFEEFEEIEEIEEIKAEVEPIAETPKHGNTGRECNYCYGPIEEENLRFCPHCGVRL